MPQATRPTSFNPDGQPNRTPVGYDLNHANPATWYPVISDNYARFTHELRTVHCG